MRDETLLKNPTYTANGIRMSQNSSVPSSCRVAGMSGVREIVDEALGGVGGSAGRKKDGMDATLDYRIAVSIGNVRAVGEQLTMMEMYRTMFGMSDGLVAHIESTNCPIAAPSGLAKLASAVALVRPLSENQRSLYRVGAHRQKGCASPIRNCPNMASPKMPPSALVPA